MAPTEINDILQDDKLAKKIAVFKFLIEEMKKAGFSQLKGEYGKDSKLAAQKLLFFICLMEKKLKGNNATLFEIFDNFYALPYGHVESDILSFLNDNLHPTRDFELNDTDKQKYIDIINSITKKYPFLKNINTSDMINFSHSLPSWHETFFSARIKNKNAEKIDKSLYLKDLEAPYTPLTV